MTGPQTFTIHNVTVPNAPAWVQLSGVELAARTWLTDDPDEVVRHAVDIADVLTTLAQYRTLYSLWPAARTIHGEPVELADLHAAGLR